MRASGDQGQAGPPLVVLTSVHGARDGDRLVLDAKAMDGILHYQARWPGPVYWMLTLSDQPPAYARSFATGDLPFAVIDVTEDRSDVPGKLPPGALLLASGDNHHDLGLWQDAPGAVVYVIEYTLKTRIDILRTAALPWYRKARSLLWELGTERRRRQAIRAGAGLQCNGLPGYRAFAGLSGRAMQFFDTRLGDDWTVSAAHLAARQAQVRRGEPLRLAFSGRLSPMKGVHYILPLIDRLEAAGVDFVFRVFGDGELAASLRASGSSRIALEGPVAFPDAWVPAMRDGVDLFVCPHPQGDPSCTYLETLGCGVPIVGFANEAWTPLAELGDFGRAVATGDLAALAREIIALDRDRDGLAAMMQAAADFAHGHSMERVFDQRVDHLRAVAAAAG